MASRAEAEQLSRLDPQHGPKSPEIGARKGFLAMMTGTTTPGYKVPLHVMDAALKQQMLLDAMQSRKRG